MRHRIGMAAQTGLGGNPDPAVLDNQGKLTKDQKAMMKEAMKLWKPLEYGVDYKLGALGVGFGREPAYWHEDHLIIYIAKRKKDSYIQSGFAVGYWASSVVMHTKFYRDYKRNCKFVRFIDKWHKKIYAVN